jgi:signal peptidase II
MSLLENKYFLFVTIFFTFILDRLFKSLVLTKDSFFVMDNFLKIGFYRNWGIALSLPVSSFVICPLIILILLLVFYYLILNLIEGKYQLIWASGLVFVGAFSNLLDRFRFGYVVDYINMAGRFPVFNLADVMIVIGVAIIFLNVFRKKEGRV